MLRVMAPPRRLLVSNAVWGPRHPLPGGSVPAKLRLRPCLPMLLVILCSALAAPHLQPVCALMLDTDVQDLLVAPGITSAGGHHLANELPGLELDPAPRVLSLDGCLFVSSTS